MRSHGVRRCDLCADVMPDGVPSRTVTLTPVAAAGLLDTTEPLLVPTWTQEADLMVRMEVCLWCAEELAC